MVCDDIPVLSGNVWDISEEDGGFCENSEDDGVFDISEEAVDKVDEALLELHDLDGVMVMNSVMVV